jgi:MFS family permease
MAIGLSAYDVGEDGRGFRLGAGIWSAVSAIVAFFIGGWLAGRSSAFRDRRHAVLNGAMVWAVAIPLVMILLSGGAAMIGSGLTANPNVSSRVDQPQAMAYDGEAQPAGARLGEALSPQLVQRTTDSASAAAWWTLVSLLLGLAAAALGGSLGARDDDLDLSHRESDRRPETPALT